MQLFRVLQIGYCLFSLIGTGIFLAALVTVMGWPQVRSRGLWLACLGLKTLVAAGYTTLALVHLITVFGGLRLEMLSGELTNLVALLLAAFGLAGDGLLLAGLVSLGGVFRAVRRGSEINVPPPAPR